MRVAYAFTLLIPTLWAMIVFAAPTQDARARLIGTWELAEFTLTDSKGTVTTPWGKSPVGRLTYDADGNVTAILMHELRNEASGRNSPADVQADFSAYFGTYTVDAERRVIYHQVTGSLAGARASGVLERAFEFRGDDLVLTFGAPLRRLVWKRLN